MANEEHVSVLVQGAGVWNTWRESRPRVVADFSGAGLRGLDLSGANLERAILSGADLRGAILRDAQLTDANLDRANLFKAVLDGADLAGASLVGVQFLTCAQLAVTHHWQAAYRDDELACGAPIPT
jgi:uncharacterized protein YjbI with pentapeptide repeats